MVWYCFKQMELRMKKSSPTYSRIQEFIFKLIKESGENASIPSERELCALFGVCRDTVRRAVTPLTDEGVLIARRGIGTKVNPAFLKKKHGISPKNITVGIVLYAPDATVDLDKDEYIKSIISNILYYCSFESETPARVVMLPLHPSSTMSIENILSQNISGLIWISPDEAQKNIIMGLIDRNIPVLTVNRKFNAERIPYITSDHYYGGFIAGEYLYKLGHKKIILAGYNTKSPFFSERCKGFMDSFSKNGTAYDRSMLIKSCDKTIDFFNLFIEKIRKSNFSAIFIPNVYYLGITLHALQKLGRRIPEDCSILICDEPYMELLPGIEFTRIKQPLERLGLMAADCILKIIIGKQTKVFRQSLKPELVIGHSCRNNSINKKVQS